MNSNTKALISGRIRLLSGAGIAAIALAAAPAMAQDAGSESITSSEAEQPQTGDVIFVTGTRIQRPEVATATPVIAITAENIVQSGQTNVTELLKQTPALFNSEDNFAAAGSQARTGGAGVNLLDLRGLGQCLRHL